MKIKGNLQLKYKNSKTAKTVYESLEVDNIGFLESKLKNNTIEYELDNDSLETFLSTADDLIASEIVFLSAPSMRAVIRCLLVIF